MRSWKWLISLLALCVLLLLVFLPQFLSTTLGKRFFIHSIEAKTHTHATIQSLSLSWFGPQRLSKLDMDSAEFQGHFETLDIGVPLWRVSDLFQLKNVRLSGDLKISEGTLRFQKQGFENLQIDQIDAFARTHEGTIDFTAHGVALQQSQQGSFSLQGQILHLSEPLPSFSVHIDLSAFPTLPLARILAAQDIADETDLLQTIGNSMNLQASASMQKGQGLLDLSLHTPNVNGELRGNLTREALTLREPLIASLQLTPDLAHSLLRDMNPLFLTGVQAEHPIQVRLEVRGFRYLFGAFHVQNLKIGQGTLDLGQIRCQNGSALSTLVAILKQDYLAQLKEMTVWCTPLSFRLIDGIVETGRMDALIADSIHVCTWGTIDLKTDKIKMTLGLTEDTLRTSFNLKQIPADYVLKIPITGSTKNPKLGSKAALAKIASLIAADRGLGKNNPVKDVIHALTQETGVPPPNRPFPWEKR